MPHEYTMYGLSSRCVRENAKYKNLHYTRESIPQFLHNKPNFMRAVIVLHLHHLWFDSTIFGPLVEPRHFFFGLMERMQVYY